VNDRYIVYLEKAENGYIVVVETGMSSHKEFVAKTPSEVVEVLGNDVGPLLMKQFIH